MTEATRVRIEQLTGDIEYIEQLGEQGGTSTVYRVETKTGKYLLKTATKARYQEWLAEEAIVLEEWMQREPGFLPEYVGFLKTEQQSHLLMQWRDGITLTTALRQATSERWIQLWQAFGTYNLLVATDGKLSFIDVGAMRPGDRRYDIALAISPIINDPVALDAFYEGYRFERLTTREFDYYEHGLYSFF